MMASDPETIRPVSAADQMGVRARHDGLWRLVALLIVITAFLVPARAYLPTESYYVDETVYLSGLTLDPIEVVRWLTWHEARRFNVPPDRAPPVSYWAAWLWSRLFGLTEQSLRWWGVLCVGMALILVFEGARRAWGTGAALACGLLMALSPNTIVYAVNIRPYPLFIFLSAAAWFCLIQYLLKPVHARNRWLLAMAVVSVLAMYSHFFGVVLAGALFSGAIVVQLARREPVQGTIGTAILVMSASAGLWPFITAAVLQSGGNERPPPPELSDFVRYVYRGLFGHPAMSVSWIALGAAGASFLILGLISLLPKRRGSEISYAMFEGLASGMLAAVTASFMFSAFDSMAAWYNLWRIPAFALLLGSCWVVNQLHFRLAARCLMVTLIVSSACGAYQLMAKGNYFTSGPHRRIAEVIRPLCRSKVAIVHDGGPDWGEAYFPIHFAFQDGVDQFLIDESSLQATTVKPLPDGVTSTHLLDLPHEFVVVVRAQQQGWRDLAEQIRYGDRQLPRGPALEELIQSENRWRLVDQRLFVAQVAAEMHVFQRVDQSAD